MAETVQVEIERKYDVDGQASLPRLNGVAGVGQVRYRQPVALEAVYFDTAQRDLSANGVTLRRRTGGTDAGWHVKIGRGERRLELKAPLGRPLTDGRTATVPERILDLVRVHVRGRELAPIASLTTLRSVVELLDGQGRLLAEVSDDQVAAMAARRAEPRVQHWREWEIEVIDAGLATTLAGSVDAFLDAFEPLLGDAGARPSAAGSKVEKVVGREADPLDPRAPLDVAPDGAPRLQAVLAATVRAQLKTLKGWDPLVRRDVKDSVHQYRVACRTLRSILQIYAPLLEPEATRAVVADLKRLGALLSHARDAEVVRDQVKKRMARLPGGRHGTVAGLVTDTTVRRLRRAADRVYRENHARQTKRMSSPTYFQILDGLDAFALQPPLRPAPVTESGAAGPSDTGGATEAAPEAAPVAAAEAMAPLAVAQVDVVLRLAAAVGVERDREQRIELMHDVRKEAKRLRYAVDAVQEATGLDLGAELVSRMATAEQLQEVLGDHRDSVMFQEHVLATSRRAARKGEDTFGYGVLFAAEFALQARTEAEAEVLVAELSTSHPGRADAHPPYTGSGGEPPGPGAGVQPPRPPDRSQEFMT